MNKGIPYKPGTKSFIIAQKLIAGEDTAKIEKDLRVARKTISNVKSKIKGIGLLARKEPPRTETHPLRDQNINQRNIPQGSRTSPGSPASPTVPPKEPIGEVPGTRELPSLPRSLPEESLRSIRGDIEALKTLIGNVIGEKHLEGSTEDETEGKIKIDTGSLIQRTIIFTPKSLMFFDIIKKDGYPGDLSDYVNDVISKFYDKKGLALGLIQRRIID